MAKARLAVRQDLARRNAQHVEWPSQDVGPLEARHSEKPAVGERDARPRGRRAPREDDDALDRAVDGRLEHGRKLRHAPPLRHDRGESRRRQRHDAREGLEQQERLVVVGPVERARPAQGAGDRHDGEQEVGERGLSHSQPKRDRHEERKAQKLERQVPARRGRGNEPAEDDQSDQDHPEEQEGGLDPLGRVVVAATRRPGQQHRRHEQGAGGVAQPPRQPDRPEVRPRGEAAQAQARAADRGTQRRGRSPRRARRSGRCPALDRRRAVRRRTGGRARRRRPPRACSRRRSRAYGASGARSPQVRRQGADEDPGPDADSPGSEGPRGRCRSGPRPASRSGAETRSESPSLAAAT